MRPEIQAFAPARGRFMAILMDEIGGLCSGLADLGCCFGIVKFITEFQPNKIHYQERIGLLKSPFLELLHGKQG